MDRPPTTVILPTTTWTEACGEVAAQLDSGDELLVVCDRETDPVAEREALPDGVAVVVAGEPEGCSGKANAIDAGMERAEHDRIVWTDDDFHHPPDWLDTLHADYERQGPTSEIPFFAGRDPLSVLLEPTYVIGGTATTWAADIAWGGAVVFETGDIDVAAFRRDLRRTVSDDGTLTDHLDLTAVRRVREVPVGGTVRETLERHVRFMKITRFHAPGVTAGNVVAATGAAAACVAFPFPMLALVTAFYAALYAAFGVRRWTFLLAYPATLATVPLLAYAFARRTFVWGGRRYRWRRMFDVEVVD